MAVFDSYHIRRDHKDRLFMRIFSEPTWALSLYNALNGTSYDDPSELEVVTLEDALYMAARNDLAILLHDELHLYEHQSTPNPNMPLRGLIYFSREYQGWLAKHGMTETRIYGKKLITIPAPSYYVLYNGVEEMPERQVLRLSDSFSKPAPDYEWTAYLININAGMNDGVLSSCQMLADYAALVADIRSGQADGLALGDAIEGAVLRHRDDSALGPFLLKHEAEATQMIWDDFNEQAYREMVREESREEGLAEGREKGLAEGREKGLAEGRAEGRAEGAQLERTEGMRKMAAVLQEVGLSPDDIRLKLAEHYSASDEEIDQLLS